MKKNAILVAAIMFITGCATHQGGSGRAGTDTGYRSSDRMPIASQCDPATNVRADSSVRGGSFDARGINQSGNEAEGISEGINPLYQADSSIRGGSGMARDREWNLRNPEASRDYGSENRIKADSSVRGGSAAAHGWRRSPQSSHQSSFTAPDNSLLDSHESDLRSTLQMSPSGLLVESSPDGSSTWNPSDDFLRDGISSAATESIRPFEYNEEPSVGGPARSESGSSVSEVCPDANSSEQLEKNISGEYILDLNSTDALGNLYRSNRATDIVHDGNYLEFEAAGAAASSERGSARSEDAIESKDFRLDDITESPLATIDNERRWLFRNNRAHGVGSLAGGEFGVGVSPGTDSALAQEVKARLTRESTGVYNMTSAEVARNVQVSAAGGVVTLTGTVPTERDKKMTEIRARELPGVIRVDNKLSVNPEANPAYRERSTGHNLEERIDDLQD